MAAERHLLLVVQFDGTDFHGWQQQAGDRTVQGELRAALGKMLGHDPRLRASSRTDAGVHAVGLPVSLRTSSSIPCHGLLRGVNSMLGDDVAVIAVYETDADIDARESSSGKHYRYDVWNSEWRSPLRARQSWWVRAPVLDVPAMQAAAAQLVGEHDFSSFRAAGCDSKSVHRRLWRVAVEVPEPGVVRIHVEGNAFLRNMVRIIAGTLVDVGRHRLSAADVACILAARDRSVAGTTAPPQGLTLVRVFHTDARFAGFDRAGADCYPARPTHDPDESRAAQGPGRDD